MAEQKESSVLFSLKELMNLEEDRIKNEEQSREEAARAEAERRASEERSRREAEEARLRAEQEALRQEELRKREEAARLEAIQRAEVEKARAEAEHRSRMEALASQQAHEHQLATLQRDKGKKRLTYMAGGLGAFLVIGGVVTGIVVNNQVQEHKKREAALEAQREEAQAEADRVKREKEAAAERISALQRELTTVTDESERKILEAKLEAEKAAQKNKPGVGGPARPSGASRPSTPGCDPSDPMCGSL